MGKSDSEYSLRGCASHRLCYCCHSTAGSETSDTTSSVPTASVSGPDSANSRRDQGAIHDLPSNGDQDSVAVKDSGAPLKSNLKKKSVSLGRFSSPNRRSPTSSRNREDSEQREGETDSSFNKRKVQWIDAHGKELTQVKEFERSDSNWSDDECIGEANESCKCVIQ